MEMSSAAVHTPDSSSIAEAVSAESSRAVCIAGMHRSGTSLLAGMLRLCGVYLGETRELRGPAKDNPGGFSEHEGFTELNERALVESGGAWDFPPPACPVADFSPELKAQARMLVAEMNRHPVWGWKDPRNCLTLRFWRELLPGIPVVVSLRNPRETAASLRARNGVSEIFGLKLWMDYYRRVLDEVPQAERIVTHYDSLFSGPEAALRRVLAFLGIAAPAEVLDRACALIEKQRRHHCSPPVDIAGPGIPKGLAELYKRLCAEAGFEDQGAPVFPPAPTDGIQASRAQFTSWNFPMHDRCWVETLDAAKRFIQASEALFAPNQFMEFFPRALPLFLLNERRLEATSWLIFYKGDAKKVGPALGERLKTGFDAVFANEVFVLFASKALAVPAMDFRPAHVEALWIQFQALRNAPANPVPVPKCAAVISAYNRPWALARTLPQVLRLGCPVLVVEDGSDPPHQAAYRKIRDENPSVRWLSTPENRGIPWSINAGVSYWLADVDVGWISYFEEDVDVHPELLRRLALVQDPVRRPLLTGRRPPEHPQVGEEEINGVRVLHFHSVPNHHFHAHRDYWSGVLPVPARAQASPAEKKTAYCDWWLASWAPGSVCNTGRKIVCVPGLISTFATRAEDSTWGNESQPDEGLLKESSGSRNGTLPQD